MANKRRKAPKKVAIVGGGCAAITTAWELTRPELAGEFDVTVFQVGWRLGGKGASGRGANGRVEEHGLHVWMGHYDNAFRVMRDCYAELKRDPNECPIATWQDAFVPDRYTGLAARTEAGEWRRIMAHFPPAAGSPGDPRLPLPTTVMAYLSRSIRLLLTLLSSAQSFSGLQSTLDAAYADGSKPRGNVRDRDTAVSEVNRFLRYGQLASLTAVIQAVNTLAAIIEVIPGFPSPLLERFLDEVGGATRARLDPLLAADAESQFLWEIIDMVLAEIRGIFRFGLITDPRGFDVIDEYDFREWLKLNGAADRSINSTLVRGMYDLAFAYEDGDPDKPGMAAGQGLRSALRMFIGYRGSLFWKLQAGMGDIVFAPLYEVLKRRGVKFEFFHRLTNVGIGDDKGQRYVTTLEFDVQAAVRGGGEYQPLVSVKKLPCWPAEPLWHQLECGDEMKANCLEFEAFWDQRRVGAKVLRVNEDFDFVVLGVSVGVVPHVCREILAVDGRWRNMVSHVKTTSTQCFQLWLKSDLPDLGWHEEPPSVSGFVEPFDSWADMTHLAAVEDWPNQPGSIAYFCNVLPLPEPQADVLSDLAYPDKHRARVRDNAIRFLNEDVVHLWPNATRNGEFRWETLLNATAEPVQHAFDTQFWVANVNPSDRYVLSLPGSMKYRISPLDYTYDNMTITGDWTNCGFNVGCVEAAVMSGRLAAHALSGFPALEDIPGYDTP